MKIYLIPGLGFDQRIFRNLDLVNFDIEFIEWIEPKKDELINSYATRLSEKIADDKNKIILIGHSFGGIICQEIALLKPIDKIILISSIKSETENPIHFRIIKPLLLHKLFTKLLTIKTFRFWAKRQDYETIEEQELFKDMILKHSDNYLQWALKELSIWQSSKLPANTKQVHIHGDSDKTFPANLITEPKRIIENAGHFMVYKKPEILSKTINDELNLSR